MILRAFAFSLRPLLAALAAVLLAPSSAKAQALTPPPGIGSITFGWQLIENTGHVLTNGAFSSLSQSVTTSILAEVDFGVTERFAATVAIPFVFARYTGGSPPPSGEGRDSCDCWNHSFQDFSIAGRYRFGDEFWALTPQARVILPSHDYPYQGEAVVGPNLNQVLLGVNWFWWFVPKATMQGAYTFALVEKVHEDMRPNRSNFSASIGYALTRSLNVHGGAAFQKNHNGFTSFYLRNEATDEQKAEQDRLLKMRYWHVIGGISYSAGFADLFISVQPYVWGRDTHDGIAYTVGSTWSFDFFRRAP